MDNVIFIEFYDKKKFPKGIWLNEPDLCSWENKYPCLIFRDMDIGIWKGFVGIDGYHHFYGKSINEIINISNGMDLCLSVYGGLTMSGKLPSKYKHLNKNFWWFGFETSHGGDLMPMIDYDFDANKDLSNMTYKDIRFVRRETNKLSNNLFKLK